MSSRVDLTPQERDRFVRYCLQQAKHHHDTAAVAPGATLPALERWLAAAYDLVATDLHTTLPPQAPPTAASAPDAPAA